MCKKNSLEDMKVGKLELLLARDFLVKLKREFSRGDNK